MLRPVNVWIIAKREEVEEKIGSLYIAKHIQEKKNKGIVLAVGPDVKNCVVGDKIVFGKYAGDEQDDVMFIKDDEILAVEEKK